MRYTSSARTIRYRSLRWMREAGRRIDAHQLVVQKRNPAFGGDLLELAANLRRCRRSIENSASQCAQIKAAPADDQRAPPAPRDIDDRGTRHRDELRDVEGLVGGAHVDKMMRHAAALLGGWLRGADIHPSIELARIRVDDFGAESLGNRHRDRGLAGSGRAYDEADLDPIGTRAHRRNIRSIWPRAKLIWTGRPWGQLVLNCVRSSSASNSRISGSASARPTRTEP